MGECDAVNQSMHAYLNTGSTVQTGDQENTYQKTGKPKPVQRLLSDDGNYEGFIQASPAKGSKGNRENYSPGSTMGNNIINESLMYLN